MATGRTQLRLLITRNLQLKWAQKKKTVVEMVMPAFTFALIVMLKVLSSAITIPPMTHSPVELRNLPLSAFLEDEDGTAVLLYAPATIGIASEVEQVIRNLNDTEGLARGQVVGLQSSAALDDYFKAYTSAQGESQPEVEPANREDMLRRPWAGIVFQTNECGDGPCQSEARVTLANLTTYTLRLNGSQLPSTVPSQSVFEKALDWNAAASQAVRYASSGFLTLQHAVNAAIFGLRSQQVEIAGRDVSSLRKRYLEALLSFQTFPSAAAQASALDEDTLQLIAPFYLVLGFLPLIQKLSYQLVEEKETKRREAMKVMGLKGDLFVLGWIGTYFLLASCPVLLLLGLTAWGGIMAQAHLLVFALSLVLFLLSIFAFSFLVSVCFNKAKVAGQVGNLAVLLLLAPRYLLKPRSSFTAVFAACLSSPIAFSYVFSELLQPGSGPVRAGFGLGALVTMLLVDTVAYFILGYYLDAVLPSTYGVPRSPWFPCRWCGALKSGLSRKAANGAHQTRQTGGLRGPEERREAEDASSEAQEMSSLFRSSADVEVVQVTSDSVEGKRPDSEPSLRLRDLSKLYTETNEEGRFQASCRCGSWLWGGGIAAHEGAPPKHALEAVSMNLNRGEILALIGQNGAGKTTLVNVLTGVLSASDGKILVEGSGSGSAVEATVELLRQSWGIGLCPQDDILMPELTARQHLSFFAGLRGIPKAEMREEIETLAAEMDLTAKLDQPHGTLSGGQKKKVGVLVALLGKAQVVCLDEPTVGVDPVSRRAIWRLLQQHKVGRIIILTTHLMDEAELLGDRIAFLSHGRLQVPVSRSLALKRSLGIGYVLRCELWPNSSIEDATQLGETVLRLVPGQELGPDGTHLAPADSVSSSRMDLARLSHTGTAYFSLPMEHLSSFPALFEQLEAGVACRRWGLRAFDISVPSLEEVFLRLSEAAGRTNVEALPDSMHSKGFFARFVSQKWRYSPPVLPAWSSQRPLTDGELVDPLICDSNPSPAPRFSDHLLDESERREVEASETKEGTQPVLESRKMKDSALQDPLSCGTLWHRQLSALTQKRLALVKKQWKALLITLLVPVLYVSLVFLFTTEVSGEGMVEPASLTLDFGQQPNWYLDSTFPYATSAQNPNQQELVEAAYNAGISDTPPPVACSCARCALGFCPIWVPEESSIGVSQSELVLDWLLSTDATSNPSKPTQVGVAVDVTWTAATTYCLMTNVSIVHNQPFLLQWLDNFFLRQLDPQQPSEPTQSIDELCNLHPQRVADTLWRVQAINHPWSYAAAPDLLASGALMLAVLLGMGYSGLPVLFGSGIMKEQELFVLAAQRSLGLFPPVLWLHTLFFDLLLNAIPVFLTLIAFSMMGKIGHVVLGNNTLGAILVLMLSGCAGNAQAYCMASHFHRLPSYQLTLSMLSTFVSLFLFIFALVVAGMTSGIDGPMTSGWLSFLFSILSPQFGLFWGLLQLGVEATQRLEEQSRCTPVQGSAMAPGCAVEDSLWLVLRPERLGIPLLAQFTATWGYLFLRIYYDGWVWPGSVKLSKPPLLPSAEELDRKVNLSATLEQVCVQSAHTLSLVNSGDQQGGATSKPDDEGSDDVEQEERRVARTLQQTTRSRIQNLDPVCLFQLRKVYPRKQGDSKVRHDDEVRVQGLAAPASFTRADRGSGPTFDVAVDRLSMAVPRGEIFGLLGHNGAGKSTSIGMLSGEVIPTAGQAWLNGKQAASATLHSRVGFCRQFGGLQEQLTCSQHLALGARLRGVPEKHVSTQVQQLLQALGMSEFADRDLQYCSGGTKRKVAVALALLAKPGVLLLDEASAGMDPVSRRKLWDLLRGTASSGYTRATVLTTHSMTEAEALCDRIGILVAGRLRCLGTSDHLKRKYAKGYCCAIRTIDSEVAVSAVRSWFLGLFATSNRKEPAAEIDIGAASSGSQLVEEYGGQLRFWVPAGRMKLSALFRELDAAKPRFAIEEYSVSQPSLEQVFLAFARTEEGLGL